MGSLFSGFLSAFSRKSGVSLNVRLLDFHDEYR